MSCASRVVATILLGTVVACTMSRAASAQDDSLQPISDTDPLYAVLSPIARRITGAAQISPPIAVRFTIVAGSEPNAFATDDRVYVTSALFSYLTDRDELAGVLCHELAHIASHDEARERAADSRIGRDIAVGGAAVGTNRSVMGAIAEGTLGALAQRGYSRDVELAADARGVATCARAGYNPWGLVWVLRSLDADTQRERFEMLADHPFANRRIEALEDLFRSDPTTYARFSPIPPPFSSSP